MTDTSKVYLSLSSEALAVLDKQSTPRKRGEFVSRMLVQYGEVSNGTEQIDIEGIKLQLMGLASVNKTLEGSLMNLEKQLAALIARR